jgi:hypothetical protein
MNKKLGIILVAVGCTSWLVLLAAYVGYHCGYKQGADYGVATAHLVMENEAQKC